MSDINSIVSLVPKKKKESKKTLNLLVKSINISHHIHPSNSNPKPFVLNKYTNQFFDINNNIIMINKKYSSQKKFEKMNIKKILTEENTSPRISKKNIKIISEKDLITEEEEEPTTPLMNLQKLNKPNYLMKSEFIKDKSLTPKENLYQHNLNPIYDFFKMETEFNTNTTKNEEHKKENNNLKNASFTQYYNNFKQLTKNKSIDKLEAEQMDTINEINNDKLFKVNDEENNMEYNENFFDKQNIGENTPTNLGETFSPLYDLLDDNIFNHENNYNNTNGNYKQMNVNININNHQQNNNIYYHVPYIINNINSGNTNNNYYFNNNNQNQNYNNTNNINNNENINDNNDEQNELDNDDNEDEDIIYNIQMNEKMNLNLNEINNYNGNVNNIVNIGNNYFPKNNLMYPQMNNNIYQNNFENNNIINNINEEQYNQNNNNFNNFINNNGNINFSSNVDPIKLNQILQLKQNLDNYLNNYSGKNNNNINTNNINYNIQLNNNINNKSNKLKNFKQNIYNNNINNNMNNNINNNINNNLNYLQMLSNINNNNINNNINNNQFQNLNQENLFFNNNNISYPNQNQQMYNGYYPYQNNLINNLNLNNYNNNFNYAQDKDKDNYIKKNLNIEQMLLKTSPYELVENCHIFSKYQSGCRYLQDYISANSNDNILIKAFFEKLLEHIKELSIGQFSHYFVKKLLLFLNEFQILKLIKILSPVVEEISTNQYGTKVIQDLIDLIKTEKAFHLLLNIITPYIKLLIIDLNGTQIVFKLITKYKNVKIIENIICVNIKEIAFSKKGCNFLIKYFDYTSEENLINIKKNILLNLKDIITDQFGNYVIQHILLKTTSEIINDFVNEIKNNIVYFSNNKFSSNAVEKCFENEFIKKDVLNIFMMKDIFEKIIMDKYGNYVVQKAIANADDKEKIILLELLKQFIPELKNKYFGEKLLSKMEFLYPDFFLNQY